MMIMKEMQHGKGKELSNGGYFLRENSIGKGSGYSFPFMRVV
ncbi:hypothetical protein B4119_3116 [Parageobacillus caldoxylosilyticus]|uniref:Uncharacterized protein n=1 Tax=Saccharococcus caldoxylosilyticus TaxID=81408 RepID=A0A150LPP7_9BACL|nr:hypothetical protein B4119_3116 [Parageobacillus caldoxylosilyticus]